MRKPPEEIYEKSSQVTNWILDLGVTCHRTQEISDLMLGSLVETDKYIEVADGHFATAKKAGEVQIKMHDNNGKPLIDIL